MRWRDLAPLAALALLTPGLAEAHAFTTGLPFDLAFLSGVLTLVSAPEQALPILTLGVGSGIWFDGRQRRLWLAFVIGMGATLAVAPLFVGDWAGMVSVFFGIVIAAHAALLSLAWTRVMPVVLGAVMGFAVSLSGFYGHAYGEVQIATQLGYMATALALLILSSKLVQFTRRVFPGAVVPILWRIVSSWLAAILVLYLAFAYVNGG